MVLQAAVRDVRIARDVASGVPLPRSDRPQPRFLTRQEVERLAVAADQVAAGDGDPIRFLALTGPSDRTA